MKNLVKVFIGMVIIIVIVIAGIWGKNYMDKRALENDYQQGMELIQSYVTDYLVNNYEGIEKIEWQGVGVEWRHSPIYGPSIMGNYVTSKANVYVTDDIFFTIDFSINEEMDYDIDTKKYVLKKSMNTDNLDSLFEMEIRNAKKQLNTDESLKFEQFRKTDNTNSNVNIVFNANIYELQY